MHPQDPLTKNQLVSLVVKQVGQYPALRVDRVAVEVRVHLAVVDHAEVAQVENKEKPW